MDINIPNLGDGIDSAQVLSVLVSVGDTVTSDQTLIELETDKAVAPVPSPGNGVIAEILTKEGDTVKTGSLIMKLKGEKSSVKTPSPPVTESAPTATQIPPNTTQKLPPFSIASNTSIATSPSIKKWAGLFGIDLRKIQGTGNGGRITEKDIQEYLAYIQNQAFSQEGATPPPEAPPSIDFSKWGPINIEKATSLRKKISQKMRSTWNLMPHVTQFEEADITNLMDIRKSHKPTYEKKKAPLTVTVFTLKAAVEALKEFPIFNASYNEPTNEIIYKNYYHIGVAVDTEAGLMVPVIKDVDKKSMLELSIELNELAQKARDRKIGVEDMQGGTFTLSNLGSLGVGHFTPIINQPESAIMGLGKGVFKPVLNKNKQFEPKLLMPICISYDHRIIDGANGARFTNAFKHALENFDEKQLKL